MHKIIATLTTLVVALGLGFVLSAPAQSAGADATFASNAGSVPARAMKGKRTVTIKFTATNGGHRFRLGGKVRKCGKKAPVHLQIRKSMKKGHWRNFRKGKTNAKTAYAFKHLNTPGYFRVTAPKHGKCGFAVSKTTHVFKR